jgi:hypothetical protein
MTIGKENNGFIETDRKLKEKDLLTRQELVLIFQVERCPLRRVQ